MKPLDFSIDEMRDLLGVLDALEAAPRAEQRVAALRTQLESAP